MGAKKTFFLRPLYHLVRCSKNKLANKTGESLHLTVAPGPPGPGIAIRNRPIDVRYVTGLEPVLPGLEPSVLVGRGRPLSTNAPAP